MNTLQWMEILPNIFVIKNNDKQGIVYSPLNGKFFSSDGVAQDIIDDYVNANKPADHQFHKILAKYKIFENLEIPPTAEKNEFNVSEVMISLSTLCNLRCIYCYADVGNDSQILPWEMITTSIDQLYRYAQYEGRVEITFHGTGESLTKWNTLVKAVQYAITQRPEKLQVAFTLVTNGSLIDLEKAQFLKEHDFHVSFSMDGLAEIQNRQRPKANGNGSYDDVVNGLKTLVEKKVRFTVRTTITGYNQTEMVKFLESCAEWGCTDVIMVPYSAVGRGTAGIPSVDPEIFVKNYILTYERASELGIRFSTPSDNLSRISARFCGADGRNFAVLPDGTISACSRVTKQDDPFASIFFIGDITESGLRIDQERVDDLRNINLYAFEQCKDCFAKYTCSGGCHYDRLTFNGLPTEHCEILRGILWYKLRSRAVSN